MRSFSFIAQKPSHARRTDPGAFASIGVAALGDGVAGGEFILGFIKRSLSLVLAGWLVLTSPPAGFADQTDKAASQTPIQPSRQTPEQLQQLVAPIALYPDALVAQILAASTYPDQVVVADRWLQQNPSLKGQELAQA